MGATYGSQITVEPDGDGQVVITLPDTGDCAAEGAICMGDGRRIVQRGGADRQRSRPVENNE